MTGVFDRERVLAANRRFRLPDETMRDLLALCDALGGDEALAAHARRVHDAFFHSGIDAAEAARAWAAETAFPAKARAGAAALLVMSGLPHMELAYLQRGIPENHLVDSLKDMAIWMADHRGRTGETGLAEVGWLLRSLHATLFRIGRFQFIHRPFAWKACAYVRKADRLPVAFYHETETLRSDGQVDGTNDIFDPEHRWLSRFNEADGLICGTPLHPGGHAVNRELRLPPSEWEPAFRPGDAMLDIHIPKDGKMEFEVSRDSVLSAAAFFSRYFPDKPYKLIHLCTWFLDAQLQRLLPPHSNIVRFQREFYLFPVLACDIGCYERVFGSCEIDIAKAPEDTALRRAIKAFVLAGNRMRYNAGFILPEDLPAFGSARYQTQGAESLEGLLSGQY